MFLMGYTKLISQLSSIPHLLWSSASYSKISSLFQLWKYPFAQVIFDSDPAPKGRSAPVQMEEMSQAMIRYVL